jgi:hypothetical protein
MTQILFRVITFYFLIPHSNVRMFLIHFKSATVDHPPRCSQFTIDLVLPEHFLFVLYS